MSWEENVRIVTPYTAGEQPKDPNIIKLNTNECPYPPTPKVKEALKELESTTDRLRLYPDMNAARITRALSDYYQVDPDQVYVGVGSDDVLSMSFLTFFTSGKRVLFPDITYSFYDVWADLYRIPYTAVPLRDDFTIDPENYIPGSDRFAAEGETLGGIIFPNPNAPTGVELPLSLVEKILAANPDIPVIVDEAYVDFGAESALSLLPKYENLLIVQTFSKSRAMAGLRIGFAIGNKKMIRYLTDVKFSFNSYTMNLPSIVMAEAAAKDAEYFHSLTARIIKTREQFKKDLTALGFVYPDSKTNFVFARHPKVPAGELFKDLRAQGIVVRYFDKPRISEYLRITVGTDEQMAAVIAALRKILAEKGVL
ncbi:MAG: histidinol-phosphate transaminase [Lachnospiraceae bacterium]|jgi:histidinol-phosphate aminotransferase|nr:histidinol-phosphate transaminase [Lachnospiraceae bacterium]